MSDTDSRSIYLELRDLSYRDPLGARRRIADLISGDESVARSVLSFAAASDGGRLRQLVARAIQAHPTERVYSDLLLSWRESERDEFALSAIEDALAATGSKAGSKNKSEEVADLARLFRYVSRRVRHRILNILPSAGLAIQAMSNRMYEILDEEELSYLLPYADDLRDSLRRLERIVDFDDDEQFFALRDLDLGDWLRQHIDRFRGAYPRARLHVETTADVSSLVRANDYWLDIVFWNLWMNSEQAVGQAVIVRNIVNVSRKHVAVVIIDDGGGFNELDVSRAFAMPYSSKGSDRGLGHMEVAEAMNRLKGRASITAVDGAGLRVKLEFPMTPK